MVGLPRPSFASISMIAFFASGEVMPSNSPELTSRSSSEWETKGRKHSSASARPRAPSPSGRHDLADREVEGLGEFEVALVVRRARP